MSMIGHYHHKQDDLALLRCGECPPSGRLRVQQPLASRADADDSGVMPCSCCGYLPENPDYVVWIMGEPVCENCQDTAAFHPDVIKEYRDEFMKEHWRDFLEDFWPRVDGERSILSQADLDIGRETAIANYIARERTTWRKTEMEWIWDVMRSEWIQYVDDTEAAKRRKAHEAV